VRRPSDSSWIKPIAVSKSSYPTAQMFLALGIVSLAVLGEASSNSLFRRQNGNVLLTDISVISRSWGQISTYADNPDDYFGVNDVGFPDECGIEQAHTLQRHAQRFPTSSYDDGENDERLGAIVQSESDLFASLEGAHSTETRLIEFSNKAYGSYYEVTLLFYQ
jgi:hypothetical protein